MTYPRIYAMVDTAKEQKAQELYEMGMAVALAYNEPKRLEELIAPAPEEFDPETLPAMLRAPKKTT